MNPSFNPEHFLCDIAGDPARTDYSLEGEERMPTLRFAVCGGTYYILRFANGGTRAHSSRLVLDFVSPTGKTTVDSWTFVARGYYYTTNAVGWWEGSPRQGNKPHAWANPAFRKCITKYALAVQRSLYRLDLIEMEAS